MTRTLQPRTDDFPTLLERSKGEIAKVLPDGVSVDRVCRMALNAYRMNGELRDCEPQSILASVMKAAELNLEPSGGLKHCWLIPYRDHKRGTKECTFQISYTGMLELARRSGAFLSIEARIVYENDVFELSYDPRPLLTHRPNLFSPGAEVGCYAYAVLANHEIVIEWANRAEIEKIRAASRAGKIWEQWWGQMACKTLLKRLLKRQPLSVKLAQAIDDDHETQRVEASLARGPAIEGPHVSRSKALGQRLQAPEFPAADDSIDDLQDSDSVEPEEPKGREPGEDG